VDNRLLSALILAAIPDQILTSPICLEGESWSAGTVSTNKVTELNILMNALSEDWEGDGVLMRKFHEAQSGIRNLGKAGGSPKTPIKINEQNSLKKQE